MKGMLFFILCALSTSFSHAQFQQVNKLKEADKTDFNLYFYPSTLRMINIDQDTAFNKLVYGIQKLSFHQLNPDSIDEQNFLLLREEILEQENYEEYITISGGGMAGQAFEVLGNEAGDEWIAMGFLEGQGYLIALRGTINWLQAPMVYQSILEKGEDGNSGFGILFNYLKQSNDRSSSRRKRTRKRKEAQENAPAVKDSTAVQKESNNNIQ